MKTEELIFWCIICLCSGFNLGWGLALRWASKHVKMQVDSAWQTAQKQNEANYLAQNSLNSIGSLTSYNTQGQQHHDN